MLRKLLPLAALAVAPLFAQDHFATLDDNRIHYLSFGTGGDAVVFIHGWSCDATFWKAQAPLYEKRRALLIDLPGHGRSDKPEISYTMDLFARAVEAAMNDAHVSRATLVGHSMGASVIVQFARLYSAKVAALVFVDGYVPQPAANEAERAQQKAQRDGMAKAFSTPDYQAFATRMIDSMFVKTTTDALKEQIRTAMLSAPRHVMASAMEGMAAMQPVTESYPQLPAAAIMMKRGNGAVYRAFLAEHFQLVDFREFADAGHFLMMERPERFNTVLGEFLDRKR